jgi:hypothetical protein
VKGESMKKYIILSLLTVLIMLGVNSCSSDKMEKVRINEMVSYMETKKDSLRVITDLDALNTINDAFINANQNPGIANMAHPRYKVEIGKEIYFLWIVESSGVIMNANDTHTTYSLTYASAKKVYDLLK